MPMECPPGFALYADVLQRIADFRPCGQGVKFRCLFPERHKNGDRNWSGYACIGATGNLIASCRGCGATFFEIKDAVGLPGGAWFTHKGRIYPESKSGRATTWGEELRMSEPTAVYDYRDEEGTLLYQKLRYEAWDGTTRLHKKFVQRRPLERSRYKSLSIPEDVAGPVWVWGVSAGEYGRANRDGQYDLTALSDEHQSWVKLDAVRVVLYRLPELLAANPDAPVFLVEGEKDVETLRRLGFTATCTVSTTTVPDPDWLAPLACRRVVIVADNDFTGKQHAYRQAGLLVCGGVRSVRVIWPGECGYDVKDGGDITDWIKDNEHPRESVVGLCKRFVEYKGW